MKKFLIRISNFLFFFLGFFVLINILYLGIIAATDWDFRKRIESIKFTDPDFDLLVLGNSLSQYGFDTELLTSKGIKSYNLAIIGNSDETSFIQLKEYLTNYVRKPKYVVFCVAQFADSFYNQGIHALVEFTMKDPVWDMNDIPVSKFRWFGVEVLKKILSRDHRKTRLSMGQIKTPKIVPDRSVHKEIYLDIKNIESSLWVGELAKLCSQNGITLFIIEMPGQKEKQNMNRIGPVSISFENGYPAIFYNFNSRDFCGIFDPSRDWCGMSHLSQYGAARFTEGLYNTIFEQRDSI